MYAALLDQGEYLCSWRTMYRILHEHGEVKERRNQLRRPVYRRPELLATGPNQLWTWDITKLRGPVKWQYYYLYVMLDVYSRCVVGWLLAECESAQLAKELIATCCARHQIEPGQLTIHADNGSAMQAKSVALLLADLGVTKSHSRPGVSNDNPFSEAQFKTLKYAPGYPDRFGCLADARQWAQAFFTWYNHDHHHTGIGLFTPADVHTGRAAELWHQRQAVMQQAYAAHPERFVRGPSVPPALPAAVWINPPQPAPAVVNRGDAWLAVHQVGLAFPAPVIRRPRCAQVQHRLRLRCQGLAGGGLETPFFQPAASQFISTLDCAAACATLCRRGQRMAWSRHPLLFDSRAGANPFFGLLFYFGCQRAGGHVLTFIFTLNSALFVDVPLAVDVLEVEGRRSEGAGFRTALCARSAASQGAGCPIRRRPRGSRP